MTAEEVVVQVAVPISAVAVIAVIVVVVAALAAVCGVVGGLGLCVEGQLVVISLPSRRTVRVTVSPALKPFLAADRSSMEVI